MLIGGGMRVLSRTLLLLAIEFNRKVLLKIAVVFCGDLEITKNIKLSVSSKLTLATIQS